MCGASAEPRAYGRGFADGLEGRRPRVELLQSEEYRQGLIDGMRPARQRWHTPGANLGARTDGVQVLDAADRCQNSVSRF